MSHLLKIVKRKIILMHKGDNMKPRIAFPNSQTKSDECTTEKREEVERMREQCQRNGQLEVNKLLHIFLFIVVETRIGTEHKFLCINIKFIVDNGANAHENLSSPTHRSRVQPQSIYSHPIYLVNAFNINTGYCSDFLFVA